MKTQYFALLAFGITFSLQAAGRPEPTHANVSYGDHERNKIDFWEAEGEGPRPLLVYIHGGGWTGGDKAERGPDYSFFLEKGISCAAINYRYSTQEPLPAPVHDAARAIQFLRYKADGWNINKERFVLTGTSAGATTSMWMLCHEDLADPSSTDPISRESTRVQGAFVVAGQVSIDPIQSRDWLGPAVLEHRMINLAVGRKSMQDVLDDYAVYEKTLKEFTAYNHVSGEDPPLMMTYGSDMTLPSKGAGHGIHHPVYGVKMKEKCDSVGQECHLLIEGVSDSQKYANTNEFALAILLGEEEP